MRYRFIAVLVLCATARCHTQQPAAGSVTHVSPGSAYHPDTTGYYSISVGVGRPIVPGLDGEIGVGHVRIYQDDVETSLIPVYALRLKKDLASNITLDGSLRMLQPFSQDTFADSRTSLNYRFTRNVGVQLTYVANNLLVPATSRTGWNKTFRVMLTFNHSRTR